MTDRAPNLVGFSAGYSTIDGPNGRVYYENRNLFGGAERLRLQGEAFLAPRNDGTRIKEHRGLPRPPTSGRASRVSFLKPALGGTRWDFLFDGIVERNRTGGGRFGGYTDRLGGGTTALRYRIDDEWSVTGRHQVRARQDERRDQQRRLPARRAAASRLQASTTPTSRSTRSTGVAA